MNSGILPGQGLPVCCAGLCWECNDRGSLTVWYNHPSKQKLMWLQLCRHSPAGQTCRVLAFLPTEHVPKGTFAPVTLSHWMRLEWGPWCTSGSSRRAESSSVVSQKEQGISWLIFPFILGRRVSLLWQSLTVSWQHQQHFKGNQYTSDTEGHLYTPGKNTDFPLKRSQECLFCNKTVEKQSV